MPFIPNRFFITTPQPSAAGERRDGMRGKECRRNVLPNRDGDIGKSSIEFCVVFSSSSLISPRVFSVVEQDSKDGQDLVRFSERVKNKAEKWMVQQWDEIPIPEREPELMIREGETAD